MATVCNGLTEEVLCRIKHKQRRTEFKPRTITFHINAMPHSVKCVTELDIILYKYVHQRNFSKTIKLKISIRSNDDTKRVK